MAYTRGMNNRPPCIVSAAAVPETQWKYPNSEEGLGHSRAIGKEAGLTRIGLNLVRLSPGHRTSWPHAESAEEEFVYVLQGEAEAWLDGVLYPIQSGDLVAFPAGTGQCHTILNNGKAEVQLLVGGDVRRPENQVFYPLHPQRRADLPASRWWNDVPHREQGPHEGRPDGLAKP